VHLRWLGVGQRAPPSDSTLVLQKLVLSILQSRVIKKRYASPLSLFSSAERGFRNRILSDESAHIESRVNAI
jgi:hypothetical protein